MPYNRSHELDFLISIIVSDANNWESFRRRIPMLEHIFTHLPNEALTYYQFLDNLHNIPLEWSLMQQKRIFSHLFAWLLIPGNLGTEVIKLLIDKNNTQLFGSIFNDGLSIQNAKTLAEIIIQYADIDFIANNVLTANVFKRTVLEYRAELEVIARRRPIADERELLLMQLRTPSDPLMVLPDYSLPIYLEENESNSHNIEVLNTDNVSYYRLLVEAQTRDYSALQQQINQLEAQLTNAIDGVRADLQAQISSLQADLELSKQALEISCEIKKNVDRIESCDKMKKFYDTMQIRLQSVITAIRVLDSGMVLHTSLTTTDRIIENINLVGESIPLPFGQAAARWIGYGIQAGVFIAQQASDNRNNNQINRIARMFVSSRQVDALTEKTARKLTLIYEEQLKCLTVESADRLAEAAVKLMIAYLWAEQLNDNQDYSEQLIKSVAQVKQKAKSRGILQRAKESILRQLNTVVEFQNIELTTISGERWKAKHILQRPGVKILISDDVYEYYHGAETEPWIYKYRLATSETEVLGLERNSTPIQDNGLQGNRAIYKQINILTTELSTVKKMLELYQVTDQVRNNNSNYINNGSSTNISSSSSSRLMVNAAPVTISGNTLIDQKLQFQTGFTPRPL